MKIINLITDFVGTDNKHHLNVIQDVLSLWVVKKHKYFNINKIDENTIQTDLLLFVKTMESESESQSTDNESESSIISFELHDATNSRKRKVPQKQDKY